MVDLHTHTNKSDGQFSPEQLVCMAKLNKIKTIAITDHDTASGVKEAIIEGEKLGVKVISGIEVTAFEGEEIHVLGYNINYHSPFLMFYKLALKKMMRDEERRIFKIFRKIGYNVKYKDIRKYAKNNPIAPGHFVSWLIDNNYETNKKETFRKYFVEGELKNRKSGRMKLKTAIEFIKLLGGIPVLAHPCRISWDYDKLRSKVKELKEYGLQGIEVYYSTATNDQTKMYEKIADEYGLIKTLGSDYHGPKVKDYIELGTGDKNSLALYQKEYKIKNNLML